MTDPQAPEATDDDGQLYAVRDDTLDRFITGRLPKAEADAIRKSGPKGHKLRTVKA